MPLLQAYSHDPVTGERNLITPVLPRVGVAEITLSVTQTEQITGEIEAEVSRRKFPVELGFRLEREGIKKIYTKRLLMETAAKIKALLAMLEVGLINADELFSQIDYSEVSSLEHSYLQVAAKTEPLVKGNGLYPGAVTGKLVFAIEELEAEANPIWVLGQVTNQETKYFSKARALILTRSGVTSHAAILAKNLMLPTIIGGAELLKASEPGKQVSLDGESGMVFSGILPVASKGQSQLLSQIKDLAASRQSIRVLANAETPADLQRAIEAGAQGVGLCRTEHMFLSPERLECIKDILFNDKPEAESYSRLQQFQEQDFVELFKLLPGKEIVVRYLDAPLHEFGGSKEENPMLGFRGARMLLAKPELIRIQTRAIYGALQQLKDKPEVILEIPLVVSFKEVQIFKQVINETLKEFPGTAAPRFAVMVETPRACFQADKLAAEVDYLSFGTNDLTQMTFAFSRDDSADFIAIYKKQGIIPADPFIELDAKGVAELMAIAIGLARNVNPKIHISVCGEQAGTSGSLKILQKLGVNSISVGPGKVWPGSFRVAQL